MRDDNNDNTVTAGAPTPVHSDAERRPMSDESLPPPLQPFSRASQSSTRGAFHPDVPSRALGIPGVPMRSISEPGNAVPIEAQHLMMGRGINLKGGQITSCKRLTLDGTIEEAVLTGAQALEVSPLGSFKGKAEVDEAIIAGRFEGELTARKRLIVRETGSISGTVRYGTIVIEPGGKISGEMQSFTEAS